MELTKTQKENMQNLNREEKGNLNLFINAEDIYSNNKKTLIRMYKQSYKVVGNPESEDKWSIANSIIYSKYGKTWAEKYHKGKKIFNRIKKA